MSKEPRKTKDYLLRDLPADVADRLKVAAALHHVTMKDYIQRILETHLKELERRGVSLALPKGKGSLVACSPLSTKPGTPG